MFIDFTKPVKELLLQRYPYLAQVPDDASDGIDTPVPPPPQISWVGFGFTIPINPPPIAEDTSASNKNLDSEDTNSVVAQEATGSLEEDDLEDALITWHDVCLSIASELMGKVREDVRVNLGYSTSAVSFLRSLDVRC
jgi:DNA polymerase eta